MRDKRFERIEDALRDVANGATILVSGFGDAGVPSALLAALLAQGAKDLTLVSNAAGTGHLGLAALLEARRVRRLVCAYPRRRGSVVFEKLYAAGEIEVELVPMGTLCERIRAGAAGIAGFYTPTSAGTRLAEGKETREFDGRLHVLERPIKGDFAFIRAKRGDQLGNLVYNATARNYGPVMAGAARLTIAEVEAFEQVGGLHPENVVTPGVFVQRVVLA
ncbi:MAG: 3-oxoadipate CoA-transferase subunit [Pseudomonadota bacterium]|jgi:3-oxoadipate CoA-transferase alpha subunit